MDEAEEAMAAKAEEVTNAEEDEVTEEEGCTRLALIASLFHYKMASSLNTMLPLTLQGMYSAK